MKNFLIALKLLFTNFEEIKEYIRKRQNEKDDIERRSRMYNLDLCFEHRQEQNRSHYAHHNCAYCKALAKLAIEGDTEARKELISIGADKKLLFTREKT